MPTRRGDAKLDALRSVPLFDGIGKKHLASISQIADEADVAAGKELIRENERGTSFFVLLEGEAEVRRRGRKINTLTAGDFFGEIALLADRATTATVKATSPVRVLVVTRTGFKKLLRDEPQIHWTIIQALVKRVPADETLGADGG